MTKQKIYCASGWFTPTQSIILGEIEDTLSQLEFDVYSPRKHSIYKPGDDHQKIVDENINAIHSADLVVASTEGKDMGTLWECGYAYCYGIPIVYYFPHTNMKFNIMLAGTALAVLTSVDDLYEFLSCYDFGPVPLPSDYEGEME